MNFSKYFTRPVALAAFVAAVSCFAADKKSVTATITEYGIYEPVAAVKIEQSPGTTSGITRVPGDIRFTEHTNGVPAKLGVNFGFRFTVEGLGALTNVTLTKMVWHPAVRRPDGIISTGFKITETRPVIDGKISGFTGYSFDHEYEMMPGKWTMEWWYKDHKLADQSFHVYDPRKR